MGSKKLIDEIAGPGQSPTRPHPIPNITEPNNNFLSIFFILGKIIFIPKSDIVFFLKQKNIGAVINIAPPITKISEASQLWVILKKPITFSGFVIPEITRPMPKIIPHIKDAILSFIDEYQTVAI